MRYHVTTFGCQMNVNDSLWLERGLKALGWEEDDEALADVLVLNTCSVRDKPEQKVYSHLGRLREYWVKKPNLIVAVGGCVAKQVGKALWARFPFVRLVFGPDGLPMVPQALVRLVREPDARLSLLDFTETFPERDPALPQAGESAQAYVNIMQGCDNFCSYCIVPLTRGRQRSRAGISILNECRALVSRGILELTLLGQNVNSYGQDTDGVEPCFPELLASIAALPGLRRLRFTTSHPKDLSEKTIEAFGHLDNLCPQLHLPLQSGADSILRAMGRKYTLETYLKKVELLRRARPDIVLSTDLIVGFPGETEEDFEQTMDAVAGIGFENSFSFVYSDRPGTKAALMENKVPMEVKADRLRRLQGLQNQLLEAALQRQVGQRVQVLVEGTSRRTSVAPEDIGHDGQCLRGRDEAGRMVNFTVRNGSDPSRKLVCVRILEAKKHSLWGKMEDGS
jgi:tRNA-2-methylthio-N6-dimethylallyladenosine synthase